MPRPHLSEEAEREEAEDRDRLRALDQKLRDLRSRRQLLLDQVHKLSDEQKALYDARQPRQESLERANDEHRHLGKELASLRQERDRARAKLEEALVAVRLARPDLTASRTGRPEQLKREMAELERRQQTTALSLSDENALIDRMRQLRKQLEEAEKNHAAFEAREKKRHELEEAFRLQKAELDRLAAAMVRVKGERDRRMTSMRDQLVEVGGLVAAIREKARARGDLMEKIEGLNRQLFDTDREASQLVHRTRARRLEAKRTIGEYNREVRESVAGPRAYDRVADQQLNELMKRGRITLSG